MVCALAAAALLAFPASSEAAEVRAAAPGDAVCAAGPGASPPTAERTWRGADPHHLTGEEAAELDAALREHGPGRVPQSQRGATVPVVVHVISASDGTGALAAERVREQVATLDDAFRGRLGGRDTDFGFRLQRITRTADDRWFSDFDRHEASAKRALHRGGPDVLNLYTTDLGAGMLGRSTFPQWAAGDPAGDGVVVDFRTLPGGEAPFDRGHTATHEVGHWLGLFHTFQNGCRRPGDYVADTPYEREASHGCPVGRDSCPRRTGDDPVHNFMDYSDDACMREFTAGQADRMWRAWTAFRR